ncbi:Glyoxalase family protein [Alloactinosynnema sp. L-07]|uniref:VOC family protein n=1 Tax=Alloactinosynnema sp. L-07 TaxID=1653480 RepID=UPI00065F0951|nr:VOC family protein [Alloactinosynnema sp. L-07]CRK57271.1 Glyoxalase family protein [Alloactinosynnema sp. L-07]
MSGRVVHFEIPFDDGDRARAFYQEVFGWQIQEMPEMNYTMVSTGPSGEQGPTESGYINGGMMARAGGQWSPTPVLVVDVASIDDALTEVGKRGGKTVTEKMAVGDMGFAAYFTDPEGNVMGLWETAKA